MKFPLANGEVFSGISKKEVSLQIAVQPFPGYISIITPVYELVFMLWNLCLLPH